VQFLFDQPPEGDVVSLFSGGMDSVAGMLVDLENGAQPIAVSVDSNGRMRGTQRAVLDHLGDSVGVPVASVPVKLHLRGVAANEQSQRMRGLAFLSIAAPTAATLGVPVVHVYENGIGAVNLPYTAAQSGAHGTHSMHPITLVRIERLMRAALEFEFSLTNVSLFQTKAEMCQRVPPRHWAVLQRSESCDTAFAARVSGPRACGHCTSCVLRRQALHGAHLGHLDDPADYRVDVTDPRWFNHPVTYSLRAMASQVVDLVDAMRSDCADRALGARFPDLAIWVGSTSPSDRPALSAAATRLFETYANEWRLFPSEQVSRMCGNTITGAPIALTGHEHTNEDRSR
jgi:7-cyano-7-deazaguanine synthase in queuosine biosynthesis